MIFPFFPVFYGVGILKKNDSVFPFFWADRFFPVFYPFFSPISFTFSSKALLTPTRFRGPASLVVCCCLFATARVADSEHAFKHSFAASPSIHPFVVRNAGEVQI